MNRTFFVFLRYIKLTKINVITRLPPVGGQDIFPLNASFVEGRNASFGAPPHYAHCLPILPGVPCQWRTFSLTILNMLCSDHLVIDTPTWPPYAYIDLCDDSGCLLEYLPNITQDRNGRRERVVDIRSSTTRC